jgi:hypothetical protein
MATKSDTSFLTLATLIFVLGVVVSFIEPAQGRDPMSRVNLLFFCFVAMSFLLAFCKQINQKFWAFLTAIAGGVMWLIATWFGTPGGLASVADTFKFY